MIIHGASVLGDYFGDVLDAATRPGPRQNLALRTAGKRKCADHDALTARRAAYIRTYADR